MGFEEIFEQCAAWRAAHPRKSFAELPVVTVFLKGGSQVTGFAAEASEGEWALDLLPREQGRRPEDRAWVLAGEVSGLVLHAQQSWLEAFGGVDSDAPLPTLAGDRKVQFVWSGETPSPEERAAGLAMGRAVVEALNALGDREVKSIALMSSHAGRFRVEGNALEVGFVEGEAAPASRELQSLLAAIL